MAITEPLLLGSSSNSKGGLKTLPFIIANEAFEKVGSYGLLPNMIMYLMGGYGMELATASSMIYYWSSATSLAPVIGAFLADSYVGRFFIIAFGSFFSLLGTILLWLTAIIPGAKPCNTSTSECKSSATFLQIGLLASSFGVMSIGAGGIRSSSLAFGTDQLLKKSDFGNTNTAGTLERFFNWYYFAASAAVIVALTCVVYIQDQFGWKLGFGIPVLLMMLSALSFFLASPLYIKAKPEAASPISFVHVVTASWKKRHLNVSHREDSVHYYCRKGSTMIIPSAKLRFLNKACIVVKAEEELTKDGKAMDPWSLCTIDEVEELKALMKVIPIWSTGVIMSMTASQNPFKVLLTKSMDRHLTSNFEVPAGSFSTFVIFAIIIWLAMYDLIIIPLATKIMKRPAHLSARTRMGLGLFLSFVSMVVMALAEKVRREKAIKEGFIDDPEGVVDMSAFWLLPHHWFSGMAEAFYTVGQTEFFCNEFPNSMLSVATNLNGLGMSLAAIFASLMLNGIDDITSIGGKESWVSSNINRAHFDYYYWVVTALSLANFFYYLICSTAYGPSSDEHDKLKDDAITGKLTIIKE